jgi:hypothetical protein
MKARTKGNGTRRPRHVAGVPNATELEYARLFLEPRRLMGEIVRYEYEPDTLALSERLPKKNRCSFTPDWKVTFPDGAVEYHEVKGFMEADAYIKLKWAIERHPQFVFILATRQRKGRWRIQEFGGWEAGR